MRAPWPCSAIRSPTDHISPAGAISPDSPAARYLREHGVGRVDFNTYGARRGNHEVMMRGTFANIRLKNALAGGKEGGYTVHLPSGEPMAIYDAAERYRAEGVPLIVLGGNEYGSGSSRDWAAKGPLLLGVRAVIVASFERIHRSNLVGMGVLPLEFLDGVSAGSLGLTGRELFSIEGLGDRPGAARDPARARDRGRRRRRWRASRCGCALTPKPKWITTATAASCTWCCATCWHNKRRIQRDLRSLCPCR